MAARSAAMPLSTTAACREPTVKMTFMSSMALISSGSWVWRSIRMGLSVKPASRRALASRTSVTQNRSTPWALRILAMGTQPRP